MQVRHWYENVRHAAELNLEAEPLQRKALPCKALVLGANVSGIKA